jgi:hypothetical protein
MKVSADFGQSIISNTVPSQPIASSAFLSHPKILNFRMRLEFTKY